MSHIFARTQTSAGVQGRIRRRPAVEPLETRLQLSMVAPSTVSLGYGSTLYLTKTQTIPLSITLPPANTTNKVDIALLADATGSVKFSADVANLFNNLITTLQTALPGADLGFGVAQFQDYGGPFRMVTVDNPGSRPFFLNQPIVTAATASAAGTDLSTLITNALAARGPGFGGDTPESDFEALYQLATGVGFDGDGNGSMLDSGSAGSLTTMINPGTSGDVPPFSSNVALTSGSLGGMGWRPGAVHIVILATDTAPAAPFAGGTFPASVTGLGGVSVPSTALRSSGGRAGFDSTVLGGLGTGPQPAVAPLGGATVQETIDALNRMGIYAIGMGPDSAPTSGTASTLDPSTFLSALGRLTGAIDPNTGQPLVLSTSASGSDLSDAVVSAVNTARNQRVRVSLSPVGLPAGLTFSATPGTPTATEAGGTATFHATLGVHSVPYTAAFNVNFVDASSGAVLGTIPFQINLPAPPPVGLIGAPLTPPTVVSGVRLGRNPRSTRIVVAFSGAMDADAAQYLSNYVLRGPRGRIVAIASAAYDPNTHTVSLRPMRGLGMRTTYTLVINAQGPAAVASTAGVALDGMNTGRPGNDYHGVLRFGRLIPGMPAPNARRTMAAFRAHPPRGLPR